MNLGQNVYEILYNDPDVKLGSTLFITLTSVAVPEPSTWALLGLGAAATLVHRVRRRK
ncbi:MAG: PEP-CTERM sorting domain-containing protein [Limisphaerales bacterium]